MKVESLVPPPNLTQELLLLHPVLHLQLEVGMDYDQSVIREARPVLYQSSIDQLAVISEHQV